MIADLEEEKRRHAQDSAHSDDFTFMLQTERDKLLQQVCLTCKRYKVYTFVRLCLVKMAKSQQKRRYPHLLTDEHIWWKRFFLFPFPLPLFLLFPAPLLVCTVSVFTVVAVI